MKQDHYRILIGQSGALSKLISYRLAPTDGSLYISLVRTSKPRSHWTFDIDKTTRKGDGSCSVEKCFHTPEDHQVQGQQPQIHLSIQAVATTARQR